MFSLSIPLLLAITVISGAATSIFRGVYAKRLKMIGFYVWNYNLIMSAVTCAVIALICYSSNVSFRFSLFSVILGAAMAAANVFSIGASLKAQASGPFAYTIVIVSLSAIIPTFSGLVLFDEKIAVFQYVGIALMAFCIILSPDTSKANDKKAGLKWLIYCALAFVFNGSTGVIQKIHQNSSVHKNEMAALLITCFFTSVVFSGIMLCIENRKAKICEEKPKITKFALLIPAIAGFSFAFPHTINLILSGRLASVIFFPIVNLCPMMMVMIFAIFFFKEKLSARRWFGIGVGILSTVFVSGLVDKLF